MNNRIENNRLIRNFMGLYPTLNKPDFYSYRDGVFFSSNGTIEEVSKSMDEYVKYSTDWNWLMKVVEEIEKYKFNFIIGGTEKHIIRNYGNSKLISTYGCCIEFIKWYNQQSK